MDEGTDTDDLTDLRHDNGKDAGAQVDAETDVSAASVAFNNASLPPDMPDWQRDAVREGAARIVEVAKDDEHRVIDAKEREEQEQDKQANMAQALAERRERENERIWLETSHTYAGQTLSGEQWKQMRDWFSDDENVAQWEDAMMAETGQSREQVRQTGSKMKRFYDLMGKDAKGTLTTDERREFDTLGKDKEVRKGVEVQQEIQDMRPNNGATVTNRNDQTWDGSQSERAKSFAATLSDDATPPDGLAAVPPLAPTYREAAAATPVTTLRPETRPALPPAQTVQISPDNMFG